MIPRSATDRPPRKRQGEPPALFALDPLSGQLRPAPPPTMPPHEPRSPGPSRDAARRIAPQAGRLSEQVLSAIREAGAAGMTDAEIQAKTGLDGSTQRPRRVALLNQGLVANSNRKRRTPTGREATVWVAAEHAPPPRQGGSP